MAKVGRMVKETSVQEIATNLSERPNFFITAVNRLPAAETDAFRQKLFASQARLLMIKRTLGLRAFEPLKISGLSELLEGSIGIILSGDDPLLVAKTIAEFRKAHEEQLMVRGAVIDGQLLDQARVQQLAELPPKPMLLAYVVATIESPMADVIFTIERLIGDLAWLAEQVASKKPLPAASSAAEGSAAQAGLPASQPEGQAGVEPVKSAETASGPAAAAEGQPPAPPPAEGQQTS